MEEDLKNSPLGVIFSPFFLEICIINRIFAQWAMPIERLLWNIKQIKQYV
jgi:hypothetical protein